MPLIFLFLTLAASEIVTWLPSTVWLNGFEDAYKILIVLIMINVKIIYMLCKRIII